MIQFNRETALVDYYIQQANQRARRLNAKVKKKDIHEGSLVMMYNSKLDSTFQTKLHPKWLGPSSHHSSNKEIVGQLVLNLLLSSCW